MNRALWYLAILPGVLIIIYVYTKDKVEKEPISLILKLIGLGALSGLVASFIEGPWESLLPSYPEGSLGNAVTVAFGVAAFCEEIVKYLALRIGSWKSSSFNYRFDGVVYGVSAAVGFALLENVMYVSSYGLTTALVRACTAVPLHAFCGVFMGVFYSYSKKASLVGDRGGATLYTVIALIVPMTVHGIYDTFAFLKTNGAALMLLIFVIILYIVAIRTIKALSAADATAGFYPEAIEINWHA